MRRVVETVKHQYLFHAYKAEKESVQDPIVDELKHKFFLGKYGDNYCTCGKLMSFVTECGDSCVTASFICRPCGGKEEPKYTRYEDSI